jgi:hypothetical protein
VAAASAVWCSGVALRGMIRVSTGALGLCAAGVRRSHSHRFTGTARAAGIRAGIGLHARFRYALEYARVIVCDDSLGLHAITPRAQDKRARG